MKKLLFAIVLLSINLSFAQRFTTVENFGIAATTLPTGWTASVTPASAAKVELQSTSTSSGYTTPYPASGSTNLVFKNCGTVANVTVTTPTYNTTGKSGIVIGLGNRPSSASFNTAGLVLEYSINGGTTWNTTTSPTFVNGAWGFRILANDPAWDNQATLTFRFSYTNTTTTGCSASSPNYRIDDWALGENLSLPVEIATFHVDKVSKTNQLSWSTASETNNSHFNIMRSNNGVRFEKIGSVKGNNNSNIVRDYTFDDKQPLKGINYYKLEQVDLDGKIENSSTLSVLNASKLAFNAVAKSNNIRLNLVSESEINAKIQVLDITGRIIHIQDNTLLEGESYLDLDINDIINGTYIVRIVTESGDYTSKLTILN